MATATAAKDGIKGYTTYGDVRGQCGHLHRTRSSARACLNRDQSGCASQGGYSDRDVHAIDMDGYLTHDDGDYVRGPGGGTCGGVKFRRS